MNEWFRPRVKNNPNVKTEFGAPCAMRYSEAVRAMKFLCKFHNKEALFKELRKDVNKRNKF